MCVFSFSIAHMYAKNIFLRVRVDKSHIFEKLFIVFV